MRRRNRAWLGLTVLIATLAALLATTPASASASTDPSAPAASAALAAPPSCGSLQVCGYVNIDYRTDQGYETIPTRAPGCEVVFYRNAWSGVWNSSGRTIRMYRNTGCTGTDYKTVQNGTGIKRFSILIGPTWDNSVDAIRFL